MGNVLIRKKATPGRSDRPVACLQAHVDMVCEKNEGTSHDFTRDPIQLLRDGDLLRANGTTLGADNGVGVCAALAVLASRDIAHGPLEVLVTIDEETGLTGANGIQPGWLKATTCSTSTARRLPGDRLRRRRGYHRRTQALLGISENRHGSLPLESSRAQGWALRH